MRCVVNSVTPPILKKQVALKWIFRLFMHFESIFLFFSNLENYLPIKSGKFQNFFNPPLRYANMNLVNFQHKEYSLFIHSFFYPFVSKFIFLRKCNKLKQPKINQFSDIRHCNNSLGCDTQWVPEDWTLFLSSFYVNSTLTASAGQSTMSNNRFSCQQK